MPRLPKFLPQPQYVPHAGSPPNEQIPKKPLRFECQPAEADSSKSSIGSEFVCHFQECVSVSYAAIQAQIVFCFLSLPDTFSSPGHVMVFVILVQDGGDWRKIHNGNLLFSCRLDQPLIEP
jgi:hypothetical protein